MPSAQTRRFVRWMRWAGPCACIAVLASWAVSITHTAIYVQPGRTWSLYMRVAEGQIGLFSQAAPFFPPPTYRWHWARSPISADWTWDVRVLTARDWTIIVPFWMPLCGAVALTVLAWWPWKRRRPGCCRRCGYDLTGNTSGVCPECGRGVPEGLRRGEPDGHE